MSVTVCYAGNNVSSCVYMGTNIRQKATSPFVYSTISSPAVILRELNKSAQVKMQLF